MAAGAGMLDRDGVRDWFCAEILPLERPLTRYIARNWRNAGEVADLRQEIYARVIEGVARSGAPLQAKAYLFTTARNHLINSAKRGQVISLESVLDLAASNVAVDQLTPDRVLSAREELGRLSAALDKLPPRCREIVLLRKVEGLTQKQVAARLGIAVGTVEQQMVLGMRAVVDFMLGGSGRVKRPAAPAAREEAGR